MGVLAETWASWSPPSLDEEGHWRTVGDGPVYISASGQVVTEDSALRLSAVWACQKIITEALSQTPCILYDRVSEDSREKSTDALAYVLTTQPNDEQTPFEFFEMLGQHALFRRFAFAEIEWRGPTPAQVIPRHPDRIRRQKRPNGTKRYEYLEDDLQTWRALDDDAVMRIPGTPVLDHARDSFGMAQALQRYAASSFQKGIRPAGFIAQDPGTKFSDEAKLKIKARIQENHGGSEHAGGVLWLPEGLKWNQIGMTNDQAEFVAFSSFSVADVTRWFSVPPYRLGLLEPGTTSYASTKTFDVDFVVYTMMPWYVRFEQAISRDLIVDKRRRFVEFLTANLMRGTTAERYAVYAIALQWGILNVNEVRRLENKNPRSGGEVYYLPPNTAGPGGPAAISGTVGHIEAGSPADQLLQALVSGNAEREARRETATLAKLASRAGDDGKVFEAGVRLYYQDEVASDLAEHLHISEDEARAYASRRADAVLRNGDMAVDPQQLVTLALAEVNHR